MLQALRLAPLVPFNCAQGRTLRPAALARFASAQGRTLRLSRTCGIAQDPDPHRVGSSGGEFGFALGVGGVFGFFAGALFGGLGSLERFPFVGVVHLRLDGLSVLVLADPEGDGEGSFTADDGLGIVRDFLWRVLAGIVHDVLQLRGFSLG